MPEILSNYCKNKTTDTRDSFKIFQKQHRRGSRDSLKFLKNEIHEVLEILSNYFKNNVKGCPRYFQINTSKIRQEISVILSKYFKNKIQGIPEILSNYCKNKTIGIR